MCGYSEQGYRNFLFPVADPPLKLSYQSGGDMHIKGQKPKPFPSVGSVSDQHCAFYCTSMGNAKLEFGHSHFHGAELGPIYHCEENWCCN